MIKRNIMLERAEARSRRSVRVSGTWIKSPLAIRDEIATVHSFVKELEDKIMSATSPANDDFRSSFLAYYKEWLKWRDEHEASDIWGKFGSWGPFWDKLQEYKKTRQSMA